MVIALRVIAGRARGMLLKSKPGLNVRPTAVRVKEAYFSMINRSLVGASFLDLYAGYGGVGIEALSRGARHVVFVDNSPVACDVIRHNLERTGFLSASQVIQASIDVALQRLQQRGCGAYDHIFLDPPYEVPSLERILEAVLLSGMVGERTLCTFQFDRRRHMPEQIMNYSKVDERAYGRTKLAFYRREEAESEDSGLSRQL